MIGISTPSDYDVMINFNSSSYDDRDELRLAIQYDGDSARFLFKGKLLADNWFSGYDVGPGQMEVGLSYLSEENSGLIPIDNDGSGCCSMYSKTFTIKPIGH